MFATAFRRQARAALVAAATRSLVAPAIPAARPRILLPLRTLSTSLARRFPPGEDGPKTSEHPPSLQLFLGNIAFEATENDIGSVMSKYGEVVSVRIVTNPDGSSRGFGYVTFATQEGATAAFKDSSWILDRPLRIDYTVPRDGQRAGPPRAFRSSANTNIRGGAPPSNVIFCGNLPFGTDESELREKFEPFGALRSVRVSTRPDGTSRGFAHVEFAKQEDATAAYESFAEEPLYMLDRNIRVDYAPVRPTAHNPPSNKLYFYDYRGDLESMRQSLKDYESSIQRVYFLRNGTTNELTGSGFIDFLSVDRAKAAIEELHGQVTPYGPLNLEFAIIKPPKQQRQMSGYDRESGYGGGRPSSGYGGGDF